MLKLLAALAVFVVIEGFYLGEPSYEEQLGEAIQKYANKLVLPRKDANTPLRFYTRVMLSDFEFDDGELEVFVWEAYQWQDYHMDWVPADYGGVKKVQVPSETVWNPLHEWKLLNGIEADDRYEELPNAIVEYDGRITLINSQSHKVMCDKDEERSSLLTGVYRCTLRYGAWTHDATQFYPEFMAGKDLLEMAPYMSKKSDYQLSEHSSSVERVMYDCCPDPFIHLAYHFTVTEKSDSYF